MPTDRDYLRQYQVGERSYVSTSDPIEKCPGLLIEYSNCLRNARIKLHFESEWTPNVFHI